MRLKPRLRDVTDLKSVGVQTAGWQLICCHECWPIRPVSIAGLDSSATVSPLRRTLRWRLQSPTLYDLAAVCLSGLCPTDLARKFARHRSLPQRPPRSALPSGPARPGQAQHAGRRAGRPQLAHLRRFGPTTHRPSPSALHARAAGRGFGPDNLRPGRQRHRSVFVGLSLGAFRRRTIGHQTAHAIGTGLGFARANAGESGHLSGSLLARSIGLGTRGVLFDGSRLSSLGAPLRHRAGARLVCGARQKIAGLPPAAFAAGGPGRRRAQRSDYQPAQLPRRQGLSRQAAARALLRRRTSALAGVFDQPLWFAGAHGGAALPTALAGRTVLSLAQTKSAHQGLLRHQRQRRAHATVGGRVRLCAGGVAQKTAGLGGHPLRNPPNFERERVRENARPAIVSSVSEPPRAGCYKRMGIFFPARNFFTSPTL